MFIFCILISLLSPFSFAQTQQEQNIDNVAAVVWAGNAIGPDEDIQNLMNKLFNSPDGAFFVKQENYFTVDTRHANRFVKEVKNAVNKIKDKKDPILVANLRLG